MKMFFKLKQNAWFLVSILYSILDSYSYGALSLSIYGEGLLYPYTFWQGTFDPSRYL